MLTTFDEAVAFALGAAIYQRAVAESLSLVVDIRSWDRQMFFAATSGTSADNAEWVRRKINTVRRFQRASYRLCWNAVAMRCSLTSSMRRRATMSSRVAAFRSA